MPVRLYLNNEAGAVTPALAGTWTVTASGTSRLGPSPVGAAAAATTNVGTLSFPKTVLLRQWVSDPLPKAGTIAGDVLGVLGMVKSAAGLTATLQLHIRVITSAGAARGTLLANANISGSAFGTTATGIAIASTALTSLAVQVDDRIVVEVGYRATAGTATTQNATVRYGFTQPAADQLGEDLLTGGTGATVGPTVRPGWLQFTDTNNVLAIKTAELVEAFDDDTTTDTFDDRYGTTSVAGGRGIVQADRGEEDYSGFLTLRTARSRFSVLGSSLFADVRRVPMMNGGTDVYASFNLSSILAGTQGGFRSNRTSDVGGDPRLPATLHMSSQSGYFDAGGVDLADSADTVYRRIRVEEVADPRTTGPTVYWDTAPEAVGGVLTWTTRRTLTNAPSWWRHSDLQVLAEAHGDAGTPLDQGEFGGVNVIAATGGTTHTGSAAFTAESSASATGSRSTAGAAAFTSSATSAAAGARSTAGAAAFAADSTAAAAGARSVAGAAAFTATATSSTSGTRTTTGAAAHVAVSDLSAAGARTTSGAAALAASGTLGGAGARIASGAAALTATSTAAAVGTRSTDGAAAFAAESTAAAVGGAQYAGTAAFSASATAAAVGAVQAAGSGSAAFSATSTSSATGSRTTTGAAALASESRAAADGVRTTAGAAAFSATATAAAVGELVPNVADFVHLSAAATSAAAGARTTYGTAAFSASATAGGRGARTTVGAVELVATATLVASPAPPPPSDRVLWPDTGRVYWPDAGDVQWPTQAEERWIP